MAHLTVTMPKVLKRGGYKIHADLTPFRQYKTVLGRQAFDLPDQVIRGIGPEQWLQPVPVRLVSTCIRPQHFRFGQVRGQASTNHREQRANPCKKFTFWITVRKSGFCDNFIVLILSSVIFLMLKMAHLLNLDP